MDTGLTWFYSQVFAEEATAIRSYANQHVAGAHASVIRTSLHRGENKVAWISGIEFEESTFLEDDFSKNCRVITRDTEKRFCLM